MAGCQKGITIIADQVTDYIDYSIIAFFAFSMYFIVLLFMF